MGVWSAIAAGGGAVGLLVGGILTQAVLVALDLLREPPGRPRGVPGCRCASSPSRATRRAHRGFDIAGAVTVTVGPIALVYGVVKTVEEGWLSLHTLAFGVIRVRAALRRPVYRASLRRAAGAPPASSPLRTIRSSNVVMLARRRRDSSRRSTSTRSTSSACSVTPPIEAGLAFLPFTVGIVIGAGLSQWFVGAPVRAALCAALIGLLPRTAGMLLLLAPRHRGQLTGQSSSRASCAARLAWAWSFVPYDPHRHQRASRTATRASRPGCSIRRSRLVVRWGSRSSRPSRPRRRRARWRAERTTPRHSSMDSTSPTSRARRSSSRAPCSWH